MDPKLMSTLVDIMISNGDVDLGLVADATFQSTSQSFQCLANLLLLYWHKSQLRAPLRALLSSGTFFHGLAHADGILKPIHNIARKCRIVPPALTKSAHDYDASDYFYFNLLVGRYYFPAAADDSTIPDRRASHLSHRAYDPHSHSFTHAAHSAAITDFLRPVSLSAQRAWASSSISTLQEWLLRFPAFGASGSAGSHSGDEFGLASSASKRLWLSNQTPSSIADVLYNAPPGMFTDTVVKREAGKLRQLLPGPRNQWLMESLLINEVESKIFRNFETISLEKGASATLRQLQSRRAGMMRGLSVACSDWKDFNITHAYDDMIKYFSTLRDAVQSSVSAAPGFYGSTSKREFYTAAADWCMASLSSVYATNAASDDDTMYKLFRGLWSGWRTTQFFNMSFNVAYSGTFSSAMTDFFGGNLPMLLHNTGDDGFTLFAKGIDALRWIALNTWEGHEINDGKQLADAEYGEYLRVEYFRNGGTQASLIRRLTGLLSSDLQGDQFNNGLDKAQGLNEALHGWIRAGANRRTVELMRYPYLQHFTTVREGTSSATPSINFLQTANHCGGLGCAPYAVAPHYTHQRASTFSSALTVTPGRVLEPCTVGPFLAALTTKFTAAGLSITDYSRIRDGLIKTAYGSDMPTEQAANSISAHNTKQIEGILHANRIFSSIKLTKLPSVPAHVLREIDKLIYKAIHHPSMLEDDLPGLPEDLNALADAARATALGFANAADTVLASASKYDSQYGTVDVDASAPAYVLRVLAPLSTTAALATLDSHLGADLANEMLERRLHIPTASFGVIPTEMRSLTYSAVNYSLQVLASCQPALMKSPEYVNQYAYAVCIHTAHTFLRNNNLIHM